MTKLELSLTDFKINGTTVAFPIDITVLKQVIGDYRYTEKKSNYNHVYSWDNLGITAFSKQGVKAESLMLELNSDYDYSTKNPFKGEFIFNGKPLFDFYETNKNQLVKLFKGDKNGGFVLNGISVWFAKKDGKITALDISSYEEKVKKPKTQTAVANEFKIFEPLWCEWIEEINKFVSPYNDYYNLTEGITEEDIKKHIILEDEIKIPPALQNFYKIQNVEYDPVASAFQFLINNCPYELIPFKNIKTEWKSIQDLECYEDDFTELGIDLEKIQIDDYANPKWIPFATGGNGDYLLYDTDPASAGKFGQIIELQNESWERNIVAESLEELLKNEINNLKTGQTEHFDFITGKENHD